MKVNKLYEIPEDVAKVLRNIGVTIVTKHYVEEQESGVEADYPAEATYSTPKKRRYKSKSKYQKIVELGGVTPEELRLTKGRRFYGKKAQALLLQRKHGMKRGTLVALLWNSDRYHGDDTAHSISCQITNLVKLGVLSYKSDNNGGDNE